MATSGSVNFTMNRDELIKASLRKLGVLSEGETPTAQQITEGSQALNVVVKSLQARGANLWKTAEMALFLTVGQGKYLINGSAEHATLSYTKTLLDGAVASGASTIEVDSITGISNGDFIGIELSPTVMQWTTVNGAPSGTTVTLTDVTTAAAADNGAVFVYTTKAQKPLRVMDARRKNKDDVDIVMNVESRSTYNSISNKTITGLPTQLFFDPQLDDGVVKIWSTPESVSDFIEMTVQISIEDFDATTDTPDMPPEWYRPLIWLVAYDLSPEYGIGFEEKALLHDTAEEYLSEVLGFDTEFNSVWFVPTEEN